MQSRAVDSGIPQGGCSSEQLTADGAAPVAVPALDEGAATAVLRLPRDVAVDGGDWTRSSSAADRPTVAYTGGQARVLVPTTHQSRAINLAPGVVLSAAAEWICGNLCTGSKPAARAAWASTAVGVQQRPLAVAESHQGPYRPAALRRWQVPNRALCRRSCLAKSVHAGSRRALLRRCWSLQRLGTPPLSAQALACWWAPTVSRASVMVPALQAHVDP